MPSATEERTEIGRGTYGVVELVTKDGKRWVEKKGICKNTADPLIEADTLKWIYDTNERNEASQHCVEYLKHEIVLGGPGKPPQIVLHMTPYRCDAYDFMLEREKKKIWHDDTIISIFKQLKDALHWLHSKAVIHFDLTLKNTLINTPQTGENASQFHLVISDFGTAIKKPTPANRTLQHCFISNFRRTLTLPVTSLTSRDPLFFGDNFDGTMAEFKKKLPNCITYDMIRLSGATQQKRNDLPAAKTLREAPADTATSEAIQTYVNQLWLLGCHADRFALHASLALLLTHHPHYVSNQRQLREWPLLRKAMTIDPDHRQDITVSDLHSLLTLTRSDAAKTHSLTSRNNQAQKRMRFK